MLQLRSPASAAAAAFVATLVWRFLTFMGFTNDHYAHLALAQQWLLGDRPVRDFSDPGWPLTYLLSAGAWRLAGSAIGVEWALSATALAIGAAATVIAAHRLSGSLPIAILVTALEIVIFPRTYSYPKIVAYAVAACVLIAVAAKPSWPRIMATAAVIAVAFLLRHDHGLFIGVAAAVCVALAGSGWPFSVRQVTAAARRVAVLTGATAALVLPWALFVTLNGGLVDYFARSLEFARDEANATNLRSWPTFRLVPGQPIFGLAPPSRPLVQVEWTSGTRVELRHTLEEHYGLEFVRGNEEQGYYTVRDSSAVNLEALSRDPHVAGTAGLDRLDEPAHQRWLARLSPLRVAPALHDMANADAWLFWLFRSLPLMAMVVLAAATARRRERWPGEIPLVASLIVIALLVNASFLRDPLRTRLSDASVPPALLGAWVLGRCWVGRWRRRGWQRAARTITAAVVMVTVITVTVVAETPERVERSSIGDGLPGLRARVIEVSTLLASPHRQTLSPPSRQAAALMPFFAYMDRCTSQADRIIVTGEFPDLIVLAGRQFASDGSVFGAWYSSRARQRQTLQRLEQKPALLVFFSDEPSFRGRFPIIADYVAEAYEPMAAVAVEGADPLSILVLRGHRPAAVDAQTGWPCFTEAR
jgi:hypothetical protein